MTYNTYYLRVIESDYPQLIALGITLGAIVETDGIVTAAHPGAYWDYIGPIPVPTGATVGTEFGPQPAMAPKTDTDGNVYVHINLLTPINLREAAELLAVERPEIASGLADLSRYFVVDADGNAVSPTQPHRVFAT